mgnify:CR=1 FL=1
MLHFNGLRKQDPVPDMSQEEIRQRTMQHMKDQQESVKKLATPAIDIVVKATDKIKKTFVDPFRP